MSLKAQKIIERSAPLMMVTALVMILVGGLVELVPLFKQQAAVEPVPGVRPYSPLELLGRNIYVREGCYNCHSQQVRSLRDEVERYGRQSHSSESMFDHPFQWGSKRTGPDLARVGGKYSNEWQTQHLVDPQSLVPVSIMPAYAFLLHKPLKTEDVGDHMKTLQTLGVPYTDEMITLARRDLEAQASGVEAEDAAARYPKMAIGDFDGQASHVTEMDALVAYLQVLGRLADFKAQSAAAAPANPPAGDAK